MKKFLLTQALAGLVAIGSLLVGAEHITKWHWLVAFIIAAYTVNGVVIAARAEKESQRNRANLETLLRSMPLPPFVIEGVSQVIMAEAEARGWELEKRVILQSETAYSLRARTGEAGLLVVSEQEFKDLWVLEETERVSTVRIRLFGDDEPAIETKRLRTLMACVVRHAIGQQNASSLAIRQEYDTEGGIAFQINGVAVLTFSGDEFRQLLALQPVRRYQRLAERTAAALAPSPRSCPTHA